MATAQCIGDTPGSSIRMSAPPPTFPMLAFGFVNRWVVHTDRPLMTQIVIVLGGAESFVGSDHRHACGRHASACSSTNSACKSWLFSRMVAYRQYEPKLTPEVNERYRTDGGKFWDECTVSLQRIFSSGSSAETHRSPNGKENTNPQVREVVIGVSEYLDGQSILLDRS